MKVGMFMMPLHPLEKDRTQTFEEDTACILLADKLGFSEAWIGQHHTAAWEPIPSNDLFIANLLPQTQNIRLGTGVTISTQQHPANVAVRLAIWRRADSTSTLGKVACRPIGGSSSCRIRGHRG